MWTTAVITAAMSLAPAQTGELKLTNARANYGILGAARPDTKILPGDLFFVNFDIENLKADEEGKVTYSMGMEIVNPQGQTEYKREPQEHSPLYNVFGGNRIKMYVHARTNVDTLPGEYTLKVTVIDLATKKTASLARKYQVLNRNFGLVDLSTSYDIEGTIPAPFSGVSGQSLFLRFWVVGFERAKGQPSLSFELRVYDEEGKPAVSKPMSLEINSNIPEEWQRLPMRFVLPLNRTGKFSVRVKAVDLVTKKTAEVTLPIIVTELK